MLKSYFHLKKNLIINTNKIHKNKFQSTFQTCYVYCLLEYILKIKQNCVLTEVFKYILWLITFIFLFIYNIFISIPQITLFVAYWIKIWCIENTPSRSTLHSAVENPLPDVVHCPPCKDKSNLCPSTARSAPYVGRIFSGFCCHAGLFKAIFSVIDSHIAMLTWMS